MYWAIPSLNTRETAIVIWAAIFLAFVMTKRDVRRSFLQVAITLLGSVWLIGPMLVAGVYMVGVVLALRGAAYWTTAMTKLTVVWFVGGALVALFSARDVDASYVRGLVLRNVGLVVIVEFVSNLHTFPLPLELLLVPMAALLAMTQAVADTSAEYVAVRKPLAVLTMLLGGTSLALSLNYVSDHLGRVATAANVEALTLPLALTSCFVPFLIAMRYLTVWQTMLHMTRAGFRGNEDLYRFARREIVRACGVSLSRAQFFEARFRGRLWGAETQADVAAVVGQFRAVCDRVGLR